MSVQNKSVKKSFRELFIPWLSPAGAILILICFFLPWLEVHCSGKKIIGSGFTFANKAAPLWSIPIIAIIIILFFIWYCKGLSTFRFKMGIMMLASLGLAMMVLTYFSIEKKLSGFITKLITNHQLKIGLIGTIAGLLLIFLSGLALRKR